MKPGLHPNVPSDQYHADAVTDQPSLSSSMAKILLSQSPAHARAAHPKLNPDYQRKGEEKFAVGTVVHALLLQGIEIADVLAFPDYKTNAAKEAKALSLEHGRIPLLSHQAHDVEQMVASVKERLPLMNVAPPLLSEGKPELTMVWEEAGVTCRARIDWLRDDLTAVDDIKTTTRSAKGEKWSRGPLYDHGADIQACLYKRGIKALTGADPEWRWIVVETEPPYELSVISPGRDVLALANEKVDKALRLWRECLATDTWPGYSNDVFEAELPPWHESQWLEAEAREDVAA